MRLRLLRWALCAALAGVAAHAAAADEAPAPSWLRAPYAQGPVAGTLAVDEQRVWWGVDGTMPLGSGLSRLRSAFDRAPALGLGLSVAGDNKADVSNLRYTALLDRRGPRTGEWLGLSAGQVGAGGTRLHLGMGLWHSLKPIQIEAGVVTSIIPTHEQQAEHWGFYRDSLHWRDTTTYHPADQTVLSTTVQSAMRWQLGRVEVSAVGGVVLSGIGVPQRWAQAAINVQAKRSLAFMAAFGQRPSPSLAFESSAGPRTMLGVKLAPWATREAVVARAAVPRLCEWSARPLTAGRMGVRVRCEHATRVELTGDFTDWAPVELASLGGGWWGSELPIAPGLHQVQVRIDGRGWQAPPGLPTTQGDFAGTAGVLLVE
jgi:hypothetical protein